MGKKKKKKIRPLALCVFRRGEMIFVAEGYDSTKDQHFYRPIGGGIEFSEHAKDALTREVMEEIEAEIADLVYMGTLENIFTYENEQGHEIVMIFDGRFIDETRNNDDYTVVGTDDDDVLYTAMWKPLAYFREGHAPLYPTGLLALLDDNS